MRVAERERASERAREGEQTHWLGQPRQKTAGDRWLLRAPSRPPDPSLARLPLFSLSASSPRVRVSLSGLCLAPSTRPRRRWLPSSNPSPTGPRPLRSSPCPRSSSSPPRQPSPRSASQAASSPSTPPPAGSSSPTRTGPQGCGSTRPSCSRVRGESGLGSSRARGRAAAGSRSARSRTASLRPPSPFPPPLPLSSLLQS